MLLCVCVPFFFLSSFYLHPEHGGLRAVGRHLPLLLLLQLRLLLGNPFQPGKGWLSAGRHLPVPPAARSLGTRRVDRGSGGGGEDGGPSGSHCLGQRQPATEVFFLLYTPPHIAPAPGAVASLRCPFCHGHLSAPKPPSPAGTRERGRSWRVTPNNSRQKQGTRAQPSPSRRGRRAPVRPPPARPQLSPGAA